MTGVFPQSPHRPLFQLDSSPGARHAPHRRPPLRQPDAALTRKAVDAVAELTQSVLGKQLPVIAVTVQYIAADAWFIGGQSLASLGKSAFHLDISITDETNTKAEKARYLREVHAAMARLRPDLHEVSYIHVIDARGAAYGYGGKTQEYRHQQAGV
jgi:4-oxalocrotonate tautomerase